MRLESSFLSMQINICWEPRWATISQWLHSVISLADREAIQRDSSSLDYVWLIHGARSNQSELSQQAASLLFLRQFLNFFENTMLLEQLLNSFFQRLAVSLRKRESLDRSKRINSFCIQLTAALKYDLSSWDGQRDVFTVSYRTTANLRNTFESKSSRKILWHNGRLLRVLSFFGAAFVP